MRQLPCARLYLQADMLTILGVLRFIGERIMTTTDGFLATGDALTGELEKVFRENAELIYRTAFSVTGSRQDAEDILQNLFVRLLQRHASLSSSQISTGYLYRAAVNASLDIVRLRKRRNFTHDVDTLEDSSPANKGNTNRNEDVQQILIDAMAQLGNRSVEVLILRYEENLSDAQIARMLGTSRGVIAVTLYRARARLKRLILKRLSEDKQP